jgi:hypothetical protein
MSGALLPGPGPAPDDWRCCGRGGGVGATAGLGGDDSVTKKLTRAANPLSPNAPDHVPHRAALFLPSPGPPGPGHPARRNAASQGNGPLRTLLTESSDDRQAIALGVFCGLVAGGVLRSVSRGARPHPAAGSGVRVRTRAIFLILRTAAPRRQWHLTLTRLRNRASRWPKCCLASAKHRSAVALRRPQMALPQGVSRRWPVASRSPCQTCRVIVLRQ